MLRTQLFSSCWLAALVVPVVGLLSPVRAEDEAIRRQVLAFNKLTGGAPLAGQLKELLDHPSTAKKVLAEARAILKEGKQPFTYNAALLLGRVAAELKDLPSAEAFYRICM